MWLWRTGTEPAAEGWLSLVFSLFQFVRNLLLNLHYRMQFKKRSIRNNSLVF